MKCCNPKRMVVHNTQTNDPFIILVPCGHCYACEQTQKAEWVIRLKYECQGKRVAFLTLTYDDKHLPLARGANRSDVYAVSQYNRSHNPCRPYDMCRIYRPDASTFLKNLRNDWRSFTKRSDLLRYVLNFEYGDDTHRCHAHCILIFPSDVSFDTYIEYMEHLGCHSYSNRAANDNPQLHPCCLWSYGDVTTQYVYNTEDSLAVSSYVSKHCTKSCSGSEQQNRESPCYRVTSKYKGGIGINQMVADDKVVAAYDNKLPLDNVGKDGKVYKVAVPRCVKKRLHPQNMSNNELNDTQIKTLRTEKENVEQFAIVNNLDLNDYAKCKSAYYRNVITIDTKQRKDMERRRKLLHIIKKNKRNS